MCGKVHFHHLYVTGEFLSYAQSLCNMKDRENKEFFPLFEHNMVGFDFCFFAKSLRLWLWWTTNLSICGNNLTNLKYTLQTYSLNIFWKWTRTITMIRRWHSPFSQKTHISWPEPEICLPKSSTVTAVASTAINLEKNSCNHGEIDFHPALPQTH